MWWSGHAPDRCRQIIYNKQSDEQAGDFNIDYKGRLRPLDALEMLKQKTKHCLLLTQQTYSLCK